MSGKGVNPPIGLVRAMQIVVGALVAGCAVFLAIVLVLVGDSGTVSDLPVVTFVGLAVAAGAVVARLIVPRIFVAQARRKILAGTWSVVRRDASASEASAAQPDDDVSKLAQVLVARTILAAAILEGAAFLLLIAHLLERTPLSLGAAIVLIVFLAAHFPTQARIDGWIEDQSRLLEEERQLAK